MDPPPDASLQPLLPVEGGTDLSEFILFFFLAVLDLLQFYVFEVDADGGDSVLGLGGGVVVFEELVGAGVVLENTPLEEH